MKKEKKTLGELWTEDLLNSNVSELQARIEYLEREHQTLLVENLNVISLIQRQLLAIIHKLQEK